MTYLISQLWFSLLCAGLIGLLLGWLIWGWLGRRRLAELTTAHERERRALKRTFEDEKLALEEDRDAAVAARDETLKAKHSLMGELEHERKGLAEAKAQIGRLTQAELATKGEFERRIGEIQGQIEQERSTTAEAKSAVEAIRRDMSLQLLEKQSALEETERTTATLRTQLGKLETEAKQSHGELERRLGDERQAKAALQADIQKDRRELSEAKDTSDDLRESMNRQLRIKQDAAARSETEAVRVKRELEQVRSELNLVKATAKGENERTLKAEGERVRQVMQRSLDDERKAKALAQSERAKLVESEQAAKAEIERLRRQLSSAAVAGGAPSTDDGQARRELEEAHRRGRNLENEVTKLRDLLNRRPTSKTEASAAPKIHKFMTDAPRPASLYDQRPDVIDDLKEVKGIGPVMERILNENGCYHFKQLANFTKRDIEWVSAAIDSFPDRIERDNWVGQAQVLYQKKYSRRHDVGEVRTLETTS